jgi:energy-converting hydrogenase Eha subunit G
VLTSFPINEIERVVRRTAFQAIAVGVVAAGVAIVVGQQFFAPGLAVGLALALANHRVFQSSAMRFTTPEGVVNRKPFAGSVALRLGACTAVAIGLLILKQPVGWGVIAGLALFQATMLLNAVIALIRYQRAQVQGGADA